MMIDKSCKYCTQKHYASNELSRNHLVANGEALIMAGTITSQNSEFEYSSGRSNHARRKDRSTVQNGTIESKTTNINNLKSLSNETIMSHRSIVSDTLPSHTRLPNSSSSYSLTTDASFSSSIGHNLHENAIRKVHTNKLNHCHTGDIDSESHCNRSHCSIDNDALSSHYSYLNLQEMQDLSKERNQFSCLIRLAECGGSCSSHRHRLSSNCKYDSDAMCRLCCDKNTSYKIGDTQQQAPVVQQSHQQRSPYHITDETAVHRMQTDGVQPVQRSNIDAATNSSNIDGMAHRRLPNDESSFTTSPKATSTVLRLSSSFMAFACKSASWCSLVQAVAHCMPGRPNDEHIQHQRWPFQVSSTTEKFSMTARKRCTKSNSSYTFIFMALMTLMAYAFNPIGGVVGRIEELPYSRFVRDTGGMTKTVGPDENGICQSKDVRNVPTQFETLRGCRVIEGFLTISLIDSPADKYANLTYPELEEISDYILLYRVYGLGTLGNLFPNLRVIRGNTLIEDFAMVVFETGLNELGLKSLTHIARGAVRIELSPMLCFVETIDWTEIAVNTSPKEHIITRNKLAKDCSIQCPSSKKVGTNTDINDTIKEPDVICDVSRYDNKKRLCWNNKTCQKICPQSCGNRTCNDEGKCCHESCVGSCEGENLDKCSACRFLTIGEGPNRKCIDSCPPHMFKYFERRCITAAECRSMTRPFSLHPKDMIQFPFIPYNGACSTTCPADHNIEGEGNNRRCIKCIDKCRKDCVPATIDSINSAQNVRGCTRILGSVVIQIRSQGGQNVINELEMALKDVEEIEGSLKIVRSFPIVSLSFFRSLRIIRGLRLENERERERYSLYVMDNQNLQDLFPNNVTIERGKMFFHFNPKLCYSQITRLKDNALELRDVSNLPIEDVAVNSNGDKVACNVTMLKVVVIEIASVAAILSCEAMRYADDRVLLGYVLHYIPAPHRNVTLYDGRDACGGDGWKVEDVPNIDKSLEQFPVFMSRLEPYTQYAYYIKTYTIASEPYGGQTEINYLMTDPDRPDPVRRLIAIANGTSEIILEWDPPKKAKGNLTTYIIKATLASDDSVVADQANYCSESTPEEKLTQSTPPTPPPSTELKPAGKPIVAQEEGTCPCRDDPDYPKSLNRGVDQEQFINFEDTLQNLVYVRRVPIRKPGMDDSNESRRRRAIDDPVDNTTIRMEDEQIFPKEDKNAFFENAVIDDMVSRKGENYYEYIYQAVNVSVTKFVLRELKHFATYTIVVKACREGPNDNCSNDVIVSERTLKMDNADVIPSVSVEKLSSVNHTYGSVRLRWGAPEHPNGLIISYTIKYQNAELEHSKGQEICVTSRLYKYANGEYILKRLDNGNYSFTVMAVSLAGPGPWTTPIYLVIDESSLTSWQIFFIVLGTILALALGGVSIFYFVRRKYLHPVSDLKLIASVNPEYVGMQYQPDEWEVAREKIVKIRELGQGSFGMVYEGVAKGLKDDDDTEIQCAIKTVNENATDRERINFLNEANVMKEFDTYHVVRLLGIVSQGQPTLVIMELMALGDLKGYLRSCRVGEAEITQPLPSLKRIWQMAIEIADGMAYLSAKKFVHRDLAARNCMVATDLTVKIGDFGMTRDIYETDYYRKGTKGLLPVRWMSPESLKDGVFSSSSDVFSFGVVLWEMATLGAQPYQGLSNDQVLKYVIDGGVMERPEKCPEELYKMMCRTWQHRPSSRPSFLSIVNQLIVFASPKFAEVSFYNTNNGQELLEQQKVRPSGAAIATEEDFGLGGNTADEGVPMTTLAGGATVDDTTEDPLNEQDEERQRFLAGPSGIGTIMGAQAGSPRYSQQHQS